jgi:acetyltransferase-like isoleucine patch superfamily enzyme
MIASLRVLAHAILALLPSIVKIPLYRWCCGFRIGRGVRIGVSPFFRVRACTIGDGVRIGHLNLFTDVRHLEIGERVEIGWLNVFRGGQLISIGKYGTILRRNVFNSIIDPRIVTAATPELRLGAGVMVGSGHWLDFTDAISIGAHSILGGRNSSLWTHNRQRTRSIEIGAHCYLGSEIRVAPGVRIAELSIVSLGAVLVGAFLRPRCLIAGNPAAVQRPLAERDLALVLRKTRADVPDALAMAEVPPDLSGWTDELFAEMEER